MTKSKSANWNIAATHYLTSGLIIPIIVAFILAIPLGFITLAIGSIFVETIINNVIWIIGLYFGILYSVSFLKKKYIIEDPAIIAKTSSIYYVVIGLVFKIVINTGFTFNWFFDLALYFISTVIFYKLSLNAITPLQLDHEVIE
jgi:hypothetical protein